MDADVAMNPNTKRQVSKAPIHEATLGTGTRNCKLKFCEKSIKQTGNGCMKCQVPETANKENYPQINCMKIT